MDIENNTAASQQQKILEIMNYGIIIQSATFLINAAAIIWIAFKYLTKNCKLDRIYYFLMLLFPLVSLLKFVCNLDKVQD